MIRHGDYHTEQFGDRFIKVSTSTPCEWVEEFCAALPESVEQAKDIIDDGEFF